MMFMEHHNSATEGELVTTSQGVLLLHNDFFVLESGWFMHFLTVATYPMTQCSSVSGRVTASHNWIHEKESKLKTDCKTETYQENQADIQNPWQPHHWIS